MQMISTPLPLIFSLSVALFLRISVSALQMMSDTAQIKTEPLIQEGKLNLMLKYFNGAEALAT